jgi:P-type conjugative transfer protein TrbJ
MSQRKSVAKDHAFKLLSAVKPLALCAVLVFGGLQSAQAQWVVFDPTNFGQTTITALESVKNTAQQANIYLTQLQQYQSMLTQLKRLSPGQLALSVAGLTANQLKLVKDVGTQNALRDIQSIATESSRVYAAANSAAESVASLTRLQQSMGGMNQTFSNRFEEARRLNLTWAQYAAREDLQIRSRVATAATRAQDDIDRIKAVQKDLEFAKDMSDKIPEAVGVQQSMGIMNAQMNRVVVQLAQLNQGLSVSLNAKSPADVLAEEQKKVKELEGKNTLVTNEKVRRQAEQDALYDYINSRSNTSR